MPPTMTVQRHYRPPSSSGALIDVRNDVHWAFLLSVGDFGCCGIRRKAAALRTADGEVLALPDARQQPTVDRMRIARLRIQRGLSMVMQSDPRRTICDFLRPGDSRGPLGYLKGKRLVRRSRMLEPDDSSFFGIFRPTSVEALNMMMMGRATGKGLNIKGKSAKRGLLSGFVPFLQISEEAHKKKVRTGERSSRLRIFYRSEAARDEALERLRPVLLAMLASSRAAERALAGMKAGTITLSEDDRGAACEAMRWQMVPPVHARAGRASAPSGDDDGAADTGTSTEDLELAVLGLVEMLDDGAGSFGLELPERLIWEAYVVRQDISHETGGCARSRRPLQCVHVLDPTRDASRCPLPRIVTATYLSRAPATCAYAAGMATRAVRASQLTCRSTYTASPQRRSPRRSSGSMTQQTP